MKRTLIKLLSVLTVCGCVTSAYSLNIVPTFDSSITGDPNAAAMTNAIDAAIRVLESNITDNVTVQINFVSDDTVGLGQSDTWGEEFDYSDFVAALRSHRASVNDTNALSQLPNSPTDPVIGGTQIHVTLPQARVLGLDTQFGPDGFDSTVSVNMTLINFTRPPSDPDKYDLQETVAHEMDEVLGISSGLPDSTNVWPADLFRYTTNLVRTFTTNNDDAYFSVDGTNLLARYNMDSSGDYGDWWSLHGFWAPPGVTRVPQVQDAFGDPGTVQDLGSNELAILDVVGWTMSVSAAPALVVSPTLTIVRSGANQFTLSWSGSASGYALQERTNLVTGSWTFSSTGTNNPAVLTSGDSQKFYRLYNPAPSSEQPAKVSAIHRSTNAVELVTRKFHPHQR